MRCRIFLTALGILGAALFSGWAAQFTPDELALRSDQENQLKTAEIVKYHEVGEGVTRPLRVYFKCEAGEFCGCWKNPSGGRGQTLEGWRYEIAAYRMDKLLSLNMVPPTVERPLDGKAGSVQYWVDAPYSLLDLMEKGIQVPADKRAHDANMKYIIRAFDSLIANEDRTQQNIKYTEDWRVILIDHSRAFRSSAKFRKRLMYGKDGIKGEKRIRRLPRAFVDRIRTLRASEIREAVGDYLTPSEIRAIMDRKALLLDEIDAMIEARGESAVLY